jgi:mRNA interferase RelE/StbE
MAWRIEVSNAAQRVLDRLDPPIQRRIIRFFAERVAPLGDPRIAGKALQGSELGDFWRYRVGEWRIVCLFEDDRLVITVVRIGHRREVYR